MSEFRSFRDSSSRGIKNELETTKLGLRKVKKEGVAVIKFGVNWRGCDGVSSGKVESVSTWPTHAFSHVRKTHVFFALII